MMRWLVVILVAAILLRVNALAQTESATVDLALPTDNDAIFHGGGPDFYQYIERDYHGEKSTPWEGGQYGFVRDPCLAVFLALAGGASLALSSSGAFA